MPPSAGSSSEGPGASGSASLSNRASGAGGVGGGVGAFVGDSPDCFRTRSISWIRTLSIRAVMLPGPLKFGSSSSACFWSGSNKRRHDRLVTGRSIHASAHVLHLPPFH